MKLTKAQREALKMLRTSPRETTKYTRHTYVGGAVAAALIRKGFAERDFDYAKYMVKITDAGLVALEEA